MKGVGRLHGVSSVLLCLTAVFYGHLQGHGASASKVTLTNNGYQHVVVAISPNIGQQDKNTIISSLRSLFNSTSYALYNATGNRAGFQDVQVLFPPYWSATVRKSAKKISKRDIEWDDGPWPSFGTADVRVDVENAAYGSYPYTQQSQGCGEPGDFIHLTLDFVTDQTNLDYNAKLLALEWVKYRYGVFEEMGYKGDPVYPQMYYSSKGDGTSSYSVCSNTDVVWDKQDPCSSKSSVQGLSDFCDLKADTTSSANKNVNTSMMSPPVLPVAYRFCNQTTHNTEAPHKHNNLCGGKSIMEVILKHSDFANNNNIPGSDSNVPQVAVQESLPTAKSNMEVILVWDPMASSYTSMSVTPTLGKFVYYDFPNNSYIGMVTTTKATTPVFPSTKVTPFNRNDITAELTDFSSSDTRTGDFQKAVTTATTMFTQDANIYARAIILFSNYATNSDFATACQSAISSNSQFHLITYSSTVANDFLNYGGCPGHLYLIQGQPMTSPPSSDPKFNDCYTQLQQRAALDNALMNLPNTILPDAFDEPLVFLQQLDVTNSSTNNTFTLDVSPTVMNTYFYAEPCLNYLYGCDQTKQFKAYLNGQELLNLNSSTMAYFSNTPLAKTGQWGYSVLPWECSAGRPVPFMVSAAGQPIRDTSSGSSTSSTSIEVKSWTSVSYTSKGYPMVRVYTSVKMGTTPIFNAKVMANVTSSLSNSPITTITLYDDGSGNPDTTAQDGVYSAYFTQFPKSTGKFSYSITVNVTDNGVAQVPTTTYTWISGNSDMKVISTGKFKRTVSANPFSATSSTGAVDVYPPGAIRDFHVQSVNDQKVTVAWTAPGDDYDYGRASSYLFACVKDKTQLNGQSNLDSISSDSNVPSATPEVAKTLQSASFTGEYDSKKHYCAVQALDDNNNYGPVSNTATYLIVSESMSSAAIAGIVVGVILAIVALILLGVLLWYCLRDEPKEDDTMGTRKLDPIVIPLEARQPQNAQPGRKNSFESVTYHSQASVVAPSHASRHDDDHSVDGRYSQTGLGPLPKSHSPSLVAVSVPIVPIKPDHMEHQHRPDSDDFDVLQDADVAIPQKVPIKIAQIENVNEYHDARLQNRPGPENPEDYRDIPLYNHILNKSASSLHSYSGSTSSINTAGRQHISQV